MKKINHKIIIKEIENIRKKNNEQWMKIMSIAFDYAPKKAGNVLKKINIFFKKDTNSKKQTNITLVSCFVIIFINLFPFVPTGSFFNNWLSTLYYIPIGLLLHEIDKDMKAE